MFDECMLLHKEPDHPERPDRLRAIMKRITDDCILQSCVSVPSREATQEEILAVHSSSVHTAVVKTQEAAEEDIIHFGADTYANKYSSKAAHVAVGGLIEVTKRVVEGTLHNGFAFVRPPGHHAEANEIMGFCLFNNVAVAAEYANKKLGVKKILIFDWDVHHGNGTQHIFENRADIMYCSVHKGGRFYPGTGKPEECGKGDGLGFTVNVPFLKAGMGDTDYMAAFKWVFMPIAKEFKPDLVIISAGFDCAGGDLLGPMKVSPQGFECMLGELMTLAGSKVVCALEGGYDLKCTADGAAACMKVLLGSKPSVVANANPSVYAWRDIEATMKVQAKYWPTVATLLESEEWKLLCTEMLAREAELPKEPEPISCAQQ